MVKDLKKELMELLMKVIIKMEKNMDKVYLNMKMDLNIKEILVKVNMMVLENIHGLMVEFMVENGKIIKWMEKENIDILMVINILVSI